MRSTCLVLTLLLASTSAAEEKPAASSLSLLEKATEWELISLDPSVRNDKAGFHGYKVLGKTTIKDAATRKTLFTAFKKGIDENNGTVAGCFNPRHGIRFKVEDTTVDLVICFECYSVSEYTNDKRGKGFLITNSLQPAFNKVLKDAGVKLPEAAK